MLNELKKMFNITKTENGAYTLKSSLNALVDLFALGGSYRLKSEQEVLALFYEAFRQDKDLAMKTLFYLRDIRGGQGERRFFRIVLLDLAVNEPATVRQLLPYIPEYGRWDDVLALLSTPLKEEVLTVVTRQFQEDKKQFEAGQPISLLAKWLPSVSVKSKERKGQLMLLLKAWNMNQAVYRKMLSRLRQSLNLLETKLSECDYEAIDYQKLPSVAGMKYRQAFYRNDMERYMAFLEQLKTGSARINAAALYPADIVGKILQSRDVAEHRELYNGMWANLPDYIGDRTENSLAVVDVSGSMTGKPMEVAIALGIYLSERNHGEFKDYFMTFSEEPQLCALEGKDFVEKVQNLSRASWGYNTNLEKVFTVILSAAKKARFSQEQMIDKLYIISDMEFDAAVCGRNRNYSRETLFKKLKAMMSRAGYQMPEIVFWNVNARQQQLPVSAQEEGVKLVSGYSPSLFKDLIEDATISPEEFMLKVITSERYEPIKAA
ncbi:DUF2828 family protein [Enterococcus sp. BWR-S5]|uniref:DUF2828 family protein n=1 Tax=Enterococcus sp. BWR-S5 TaxID=2787714 RepID=UPI00192185D5|nr:DUF2828 family protein [Enterococcus sp. BWR-S5]MBL1225496.1 DUF2828 family protein [Enterococcus sp. BWR-S5]